MNEENNVVQLVPRQDDEPVTYTYNNYMYGKWEDIEATQVIATEDGYKVIDMKLSNNQ